MVYDVGLQVQCGLASKFQTKHLYDDLRREFGKLLHGVSDKSVRDPGTAPDALKHAYADIDPLFLHIVGFLNRRREALKTLLTSI